MAKIIKDNNEDIENEIIIGITTKPKDKVRVDQKTTRTRNSSTAKRDKINNHSTKNKSASKNNAKKTIHKNNKKNSYDIKKRNINKVTISIFILFLIVIGGTIYFLTTPAFNVTNINVYGNNRNPADTYISLSRINIGSTNIFAFTNGGIKKNIKENSYVESVTVKRKLPNTVELYITERKVSYQIQYSKSFTYLDNQGYILEIQEEKKDVPIIKGFSLKEETIQLGSRLENDDLLKLNKISKIINYCKYNSIENKISSIDVSDNENYILNFEEDKKIVYLGDASNLSERLSLLKTILTNEKGKKGEIFMNGDLNEDKVYFREEKN